MVSREEILLYVKDSFGIEPDYPWARTPKYAILRHGNNRKWFGALIDITEDKLGLKGSKPVDALNLKCDPVLIGSLRNGTEIFPAYHMNKEHWISILLNSTITRERVYALIDISYKLTE